MGSNSRLGRTAFVVASLALGVSGPSAAQVMASEAASVMQTIDGTKITITYWRPRARGRDPLFGNPKVVHWDEVWTPGANYGTKLELSKPVKLQGQAVPAGTYSMWFNVRESGEWTCMLSTKAVRSHTSRPDSTETLISFPIHQDTGAFTEVLTWSVPDVQTTGGVLSMQWGTVRIAIKLEVEPS